MFVVGFFVGANSQTIQLGSGTTESSNYNSSPVNIWYRSTVCEFVYTVTELTNAGASSSCTNPITQIGFYVTQAPLYNLPGYTIQFKHTTQSDVSSTLGNSGWTTVKNAFTYSPTAGGFDMITLDNSFVWDGVNNLAVRVCWNRVTAYNASGKVLTYPSTSGYRYRWRDWQDQCGRTPNTVTNDKPQCQLVFVSGTSSTWTGATDTDWFNCNNWSIGVPTPKLDATIPSGPTNQPTINGTAYCRNITIAGGASLTISGSNSLEVNGNWNNSGAFTANTSKVIFNGTSTNTIAGNSGQSFYDVQVDNIAGASISSGTYFIKGNLRLNGGTLTTNSAITMDSDASGTSRIGQINTPCNYTLVMNDSYGDGWNGGYITVMIDGVASGTYSASGSGSTETVYIPNGSSFNIIYTSGQYENENTYTLSDPTPTVIFSDGPTPSTGTAYSGTASCTFVNPFSGNMDINRYIDAGETNWRFVTQPVAGASLQQLDDDFITSGIPGSDWPGWIPPGWSSVFYSIQYYDETVGGTSDNGYTPYSAMTDVPSLGEGMYVWSGDTITGTLPFTIDWTGVPNCGPVSLPVSYTTSAGINEDGWCLVGNPYFCPIDWEDADITRSTSIDNAIYIWDPDLDNFASYVLGVGTNGGTQYIAGGQAFFVKANGTSPALQLDINERCKYETDVAFKSSITGLIRLQFGMTAPKDETVVRITPGATVNFDSDYDAYKLFFAGSESPQISQITGGEEYSINSIPELTDHVLIPIRVSSTDSGTYNITAAELSAIQPGMCIVLEDLLLGTYANLQSDSIYSFFMDGNVAMTRFMLHIVPSANVIINDVSCQGFNDGSMVADAVGNPTTVYTWATIGGSVIQSTTTSGADYIDNLVAGSYLLSTNTGINGCPAITDTLVISEPAPISATISEFPVSCSGCCDGKLIIDIAGGSPPYSIGWDDPAMQTSITAHNLCPGSYTATITDANGCESTFISSVQNYTDIDEEFADAFHITPNPCNGVFSINPKFNTAFTIELLDVTGKIIERHTANGSHSVDVSYLPTGLYLVRLIDNNQSTTQRITITE